MLKEQKTLVIIPAKNEALNIQVVLKDVKGNHPELDIVVINDNSTDSTSEIAENFRGVKVISNPLTLGIGGTVQLGVAYGLQMGYDVFIRMDGDGQHPADCILQLKREWKMGVLVQGARNRNNFDISSNKLRKYASRYFSFLFRFFTGVNVPDPTSGYCCFGRDVAANFVKYLPADYPEIESSLMLIRAGFDIISVPVHMRSREGGMSSITFFKAVVYVFAVSAAFFTSFIRENPYMLLTKEPE